MKSKTKYWLSNAAVVGTAILTAATFGNLTSKLSARFTLESTPQIQEFRTLEKRARETGKNLDNKWYLTEDRTNYPIDVRRVVDCSEEEWQNAIKNIRDTSLEYLKNYQEATNNLAQYREREYISPVIKMLEENSGFVKQTLYFLLATLGFAASAYNRLKRNPYTDDTQSGAQR